MGPGSLQVVASQTLFPHPHCQLCGIGQELRAHHVIEPVGAVGLGPSQRVAERLTVTTGCCDPGQLPMGVCGETAVADALGERATLRGNACGLVQPTSTLQRLAEQ